MAYQFLRGTTAENDAYTGPSGSITVDEERDELRVHDGVTQGGSARLPNNVDVTQRLSGKANLSGGADANFLVMPQVAGDVLISSGENSNGIWARFSSGFQIVGQRAGVTGGSTWTFPQPFIAAADIVVDVTPRGSAARFVSHDNITTTTVDILAWLPDGSSPSAAAVSTTARGFWK